MSSLEFGGPTFEPDGCLRFAHGAIRGSRSMSAAVESALLQVPGVIKARSNPRTGVVLIDFEVDRVSAIEIMRRIEALVGSGEAV